jgi:SAM-dependent methyltransferase
MSADTSWLASMPEIYDRHLGPALFAPFARHLARLAVALAPGRILELAAGTGIATAELLRALPDAQLTATDLNQAMVTCAAERVPGPTWSVADAQRLDFADASFDLVVCQFGVMFFPDKAAAFAEAARVLAPDGTMLFTVWDVVESSPFPAALVASLATVLPVDPPGFVTDVPHGYADQEQIRADVHAGGLEIERLERLVLNGTASSARSLAEGFCLGTPLRFALQKRGSLDALTDDIADELAVRLGSGEVTGELAAFVVSARKPRP